MKNEDTKNLSRFTDLLKTQLQNSGVSVDSNILEKALLNSWESMQLVANGCDQCANGARW
mgnify:CR=1 FL=1